MKKTIVLGVGALAKSAISRTRSLVQRSNAFNATLAGGGR